MLCLHPAGAVVGQDAGGGVLDVAALPGLVRHPEILEMIGRKRGFLVKGGEIDYERSSVIVADEFRGGKLGRITLELP